MTVPQIIPSDGYFTWMSNLYGKSCGQLEQQVGFSLGSLAKGWKLLSPRVPIAAANIDFRGSSRLPDGIMPDGRSIASVIAARSNVAESQKKVAAYFDQGVDRRPAKVYPNIKPAYYPSALARTVPQFKLILSIDWVVLLEILPGNVLTQAAAKAAIY
jgi:hypothetical protein